MTSSMKQRRTGEKGSALLVSLMVMVGLSLLGLAFVAVSETESAIAVNERNFVQAQTAAEAGANAVIEMFQDADWAADRGLLPPNKDAIKTQRTYLIPSGGGATSSDYYKPSPTMRLFAVPFKGDRSHRFWGTENTADVWIDSSKGTVATTYLTKLNGLLFTDPTLRITSIRVYAPPFPGSTLNAANFYEPSAGSARYGVATIRVTAQKRIGDRVLAERTVKAVIAETPFPTVDGAIETSGSLVGQGNFRVYWGKVLSEKDLQLSRPAAGMPWLNPKEVVWYDRGFDSTRERVNSTSYATGALIHAPAAAILARPELAKFAYQATTTGTAAATEPDPSTWPASIGGLSPIDGGVTWKAVYSRPFPITGTDEGTRYPWLYQLLDKVLEDPWLHARSRGTLVYNNNGTVPCNAPTTPHPCDYNDVFTQDVEHRYSNFFQLQNTTNMANEQEEVFFPTMDYEFWKAVAKSSSNTVKSGVYYFKYVGNGTNNLFLGPGGQTKDIVDWLNAFPGTNGKPQNGLRAGFYFFDTMNGKNPQFNKGGTLTPAIDVNAAVKSQWQMQGYIYLNAKSFGTSGQGNITPDDVYNMPGEPYRDVGYRQVNKDTGEYVLTPTGSSLPAADYVLIGVGNKIHDCQDLNEDGDCDVYVNPAAQTVQRPDGTPPITAFLPVPWYPGCTAGSNGDAGANCSEPQEPFLNLIYPDKSNPKGTVKVGWYDPSTASITTYRKPKQRGSALNTTVTCSAASTWRECTSNEYDEDGALVTFAPLLVGALYNEGGYSGSGNATYYGSLLMRGSFDTTGTPDVFFNECLARGCLESQLKMQRVMVTSFETDQ